MSDIFDACRLYMLKERDDGGRTSFSSYLRHWTSVRHCSPDHHGSSGAATMIRRNLKRRLKSIDTLLANEEARYQILGSYNWKGKRRKDFYFKKRLRYYADLILSP